jgi:PAS domain-containing protein
MDKRFQHLLEAAPDAILEIDEDGCIVLMNAATERMFGYRREELSGKDVDILVPTVKFTPAGGRVWVEAAIDAASLSVSVHDTGIGILLERQTRMEP